MRTMNQICVWPTLADHDLTVCVPLLRNGRIYTSLARVNYLRCACWDDVACSPIRRIVSAVYKAMKRRMWPIDHTLNVAVLDRIPVDVVEMGLQIGFVANHVFPVSPLPHSAAPIPIL